jgi:acetoin utilization deacetylase AcuC-like enzyme
MRRMAPVPVIHSPRYACDIGPHVFPTAKFALVLDRLVAAGLVRREDVIEPPEPSREMLERVHTPAYLDDIAHLRWTPRTMPSELPLTEEIATAYRLAASGTALGARLALDAGMAVHLGGGFHHAYADHAEGFCYLNDLAVAIRAMQAEGRIRRAAVVDLDVHQGNGTAGIFARDPDVFTLSFHQQNNYPIPKTPGTLDVGFADGAGDDEYLERLDEALPRVWDFAPELLLYQAGADPYAEDQLGGLRLTIAGLERRDRAVLEGAARRGIPAVVTFGGGYARHLEDTVTIHTATCRIAIEAGRLRGAGAPGATA